MDLFEPPHDHIIKSFHICPFHVIISTFGNGATGIDLPPFSSLDKDYDGHLSRYELGQAVVEMIGQGIIAAARYNN